MYKYKNFIQNRCIFITMQCRHTKMRSLSFSLLRYSILLTIQKSFDLKNKNKTTTAWIELKNKLYTQIKSQKIFRDCVIETAYQFVNIYVIFCFVHCFFILQLLDSPHTHKRRHQIGSKSHIWLRINCIDFKIDKQQLSQVAVTDIRFHLFSVSFDLF